MNKALCTIVDENHIPHALATVASAQVHYNDFAPIILVTGNSFSLPNSLNGIRIIDLSEIAATSINREIVNAYDGDYQRWALKPCLLEFLLQASFEKAIYVDCDIFFFSDWAFLWDNIVTVLLTPHWRDPKQRCNGLHGVFNAGFVGASRAGLDALRWWRELIAWKCEIDLSQGRFVDQKYLDSMPIFWDTQICRHRGCNVAPWNSMFCRRIRQPDGTILIENKWPIVFCHFSAMHTDDGSLAEFVEIYDRAVEDFRSALPKIPELA